MGFISRAAAAFTPEIRAEIRAKAPGGHEIVDSAQAGRDPMPDDNPDFTAECRRIDGRTETD